MSVLARRTLRLSLKAILEAMTSVAVESPGDWETPSADLPNIKLRCGPERKVSGARAAPSFTTTTTMEILVRVKGDSGAAAQDAIETLTARVEDAILSARSFLSWLQHVATISTETTITATGRDHIGEASLRVDCEVFESYDALELRPEDFPELQRLLLTVDTVVPFDSTGSYAGAPFPDAVAPAPRSAGPDGRAEGGLDLTLNP